MAGEILIRCMGGRFCTHTPGSCTATNEAYQARIAKPETASPADYERDLRMCCIRAALDLHRPGETTAQVVVSEAQQILDFLNGGKK